MQAIETRYIPATNTRGRRIVAVSASGRRVTISADMFTSDQDAHVAAVRALCSQLKWTGELIGGDTMRGMVWIFSDRAPRIEAA